MKYTILLTLIALVLIACSQDKTEQIQQPTDWYSSSSKRNSELAKHLGQQIIHASCNYKKDKVTIRSYPIGYHKTDFGGPATTTHHRDDWWLGIQPYHTFCSP